MAVLERGTGITARQRVMAFYGRRVEPYAYIAPFFIVFGIFASSWSAASWKER